VDKVQKRKDKEQIVDFHYMKKEANYAMEKESLHNQLAIMREP